MNLKEAHERLSKDRKYRHQYEKLGDRVAIAMHLVAVRKDLKLSKKLLAQELGLSVYQISRVENLASNADVYVIALLVNRFQAELRGRDVPISHWLTTSQEAKRLAIEALKGVKQSEEKQGIVLPYGRDAAPGLLRAQLPTDSRINILERKDVEYWSQRFGVDESRLVKVVRRVGSSAEAVRKELEKNP